MIISLTPAIGVGKRRNFNYFDPQPFFQTVTFLFFLPQADGGKTQIIPGFYIIFAII
ncbi:MAG: hypothetical protein LBR79_00815 [Oscillospiraceae bacterium]|nr:hypothetical protein [Oscillospiraceae bacterium]